LGAEECEGLVGKFTPLISLRTGLSGVRFLPRQVGVRMTANQRVRIAGGEGLRMTTGSY